jgi:hypothetical protein
MAMHLLQATTDANLCFPLPRRGSTPNSHTLEAHRPPGTDDSIRSQRRAAARQIPVRHDIVSMGQDAGARVEGWFTGARCGFERRQSRAEEMADTCCSYFIP